MRPSMASGFSNSSTPSPQPANLSQTTHHSIRHSHIGFPKRHKCPIYLSSTFPIFLSIYNFNSKFRVENEALDRDEFGINRWLWLMMACLLARESFSICEVKIEKFRQIISRGDEMRFLKAP